MIDTAITDGSAHLMSTFYTLSRLGLWSINRADNILDGGTPYYRTYETSDNKFVSLGPIEPQFFAEMVAKTGLPVEFVEQQNIRGKWPEITSALADTFRSRTRDEWVELLEGSDACVAGVLDYEEAFEHPHNKARKTYIEIDGISQPAPAPRFSRTDCATPSAPSAEGADTRSVLADWGFSAEDIQDLEETGVLS